MKLRQTLMLMLALAAPQSSGHGHDDARSQVESRPAQPVDAALDALLADIDRRAGAIEDLSAEFEQLKHAAMLKKPLRSEGTLRIKGSTMRWDTKEPHPAVMVIDARELKMYVPRQATLEIYPIDAKMGQLAASPLPRLESLRRHFSIERTTWPDLNEGQQREHLALSLRPKDQSLRQHVEEVRVLLHVPSACAVAAEVIDADGDRLVLRFEKIEVNSGLSEKDVTLTVPAGTTITRPLDGLAAPATMPDDHDPKSGKS